MKILVADSVDPSGLEQLKALADTLRFEPDLKGDALRAFVADFDPDLIIVRSTKVTADIINAGENLDGIIRAGAGVDNIDVGAASERGVMVANCPGTNSAAVAELAIGLMLSLDRRIPDNVADLRAGKWNKKGYGAGASGMRGRTLGIIGAGGIGTLVARAAVALDMNVLYYHLGRQIRLVDHPRCRRAELDELLRDSDVVSIHVPGGESTRGLIGRQRLALMKPDALLINTARAGVVDEEALAEALRTGKLRGAAIDVHPNEPPPGETHFNSPMAALLNFYGTHHIGASTRQAQEAVATETVRLVSEFKATGLLPNCVNRRDPAARCMLVVRMLNKPGSLAHIFQVISEAGINAEEMDHMIYDGGKAACAHIRVDQRPSDDVLDRLRTGHPNMIGIETVNVD